VVKTSAVRSPSTSPSATRKTICEDLIALS
jgi:hypothetical protein